MGSTRQFAAREKVGAIIPAKGVRTSVLHRVLGPIVQERY
jgi:hypothetical protein